MVVVRSARQQKTAAVVERVLNEQLASGRLRNRWIDNGRAISIRDVQVTSDLQIARVTWEPIHHTADNKRMQFALENSKGILQKEVNAYLRQRIHARLEFRRLDQRPTYNTDGSELFQALTKDQEERDRARKMFDD